MPHPSRLQVIKGAFADPHTFNGVELYLYAADRCLPNVEALLVEQDTCLLFEDQQAMQEAEYPFPLRESRPRGYHPCPVGTVLPMPGQPLRLHTVIHQLDESPNWSTHGVEKALDNLFRHMQQRGISSIAMPPLAHRHGDAPVSYAISLLCNYLERRPPGWTGQLWLLLPRENLQPALAKLRCRQQKANS